MKNSTKIFSASAIIAVVIIAVSFITIKNKNRIVVAKVNDMEIEKSEIQSRIDNIFTIENLGGNEVKSPKVETLPAEILELLAKEIYLEKELLVRAKKSKITNSKEVQDRIEAAKSQIIRQAYIDEIVKKEVTEEVLLDKYAKLSQEVDGKKEYLIFHIVTKEKSDATKAIKELGSDGKNFDKVAAKYSIDQASAQKGGELGYVLEDNMIKEISDVVKNLKVGKVSSEPVKTQFGWHIIKLAEIRDAKALTFDDVKDSLRNQLTQEAIAKINSDISKEVKVELLIDTKPAKEELQQAIEAEDSKEALEDAKEESLEEVKEEVETEGEKISEDAQENKTE